MAGLEKTLTDIYVDNPLTSLAAADLWLIETAAPLATGAIKTSDVPAALGLEIGSDIQAYDPNLQNFADSNITVTGDALAGITTIGASGKITAGSFDAIAGTLSYYLSGTLFAGASGNILKLYGQSSGAVLYNSTGAIANLTVTDSGNFSMYGAITAQGLSGIDSALNTKLVVGNSGVWSGQLHLDQPSTTAAIPVLYLDQADTSEEFIKFVGESAADNSMSFANAADLTTPGAIVGWYQIEISDVSAITPITAGRYWVPFYATPTA